MTSITFPVVDSLIPATIALVCGTVLVLTCIVASYLFLRKVKTRMRSKRGREPELLSYCSTVDSYRTGIIWDFESRRDVRHFLARVIDTSLASTKSIFSSLRSSRSTTSGKVRRNASSAQSVDTSKRRKRHASSRIPKTWKGSARSSEASGYHSRATVPDSKLTRSRRSKNGVHLCGSSQRTDSNACASEESRNSEANGASPIDPLYEEIKANVCLDGKTGVSTSVGSCLYDRTVAICTGSASTVTGDNDFSSTDFYGISNDTNFESGLSICTTDTISSTEMGWDGRLRILGEAPGTLNVISLSQLSINIRSCPDSPLCSKELSQEQNLINGNDYENSDVSSDRLSPSALSFSTTILDMVQGEARKRGLTDDSLVHGVAG